RPRDQEWHQPHDAKMVASLWARTRNNYLSTTCVDPSHFRELHAKQQPGVPIRTSMSSFSPLTSITIFVLKLTRTKKLIHISDA
ncbi:hypothetical protein PILCRDRAFT_814739, partial [Piloderma croceum F 1598]